MNPLPTFDSLRFRADILARGGGRVLRSIAPELGISAPNLSRLLNGKTPNLLTYAKICHWMGVSMNKYWGDSSQDILKDILKTLTRSADLNPNEAHVLTQKIEKL